MTIKIEKGIPMPAPYVRKRFPFDDMEVGDSFFVPDATPRSIAGSVSQARKRLPGRMFNCRRVDGGTRVWRLQ